MSIQQRETIDARNRADQLVYQAEKELKENADKVAEAEQAALREAVESVKSALTGGDPGAIRSAGEGLERARMKFGEAVYKAASAAGAASPNAPGGDGAAGKSGEDVIDAEVVDADTTKN